MARTIKPQIHILFPEASHRGNKIDLCEHFFIKHSFQRKVTKAIIISYPEEFEKNFKLALKSKNKKKSINPQDLFFIVLDTDIKPNRENVNTVISQIQSFEKTYGNDIKIILSGRSFEVWLCMYGRQQYTTPFTDQSRLNSDVKTSYEKKEKWFIENATRLYEDYPQAKIASILSKQNVFNNTSGPPPSGYDLVNAIPNFSNAVVINYLVNTTPFTYFEHLIGTLLDYE
ncbi:hypothetical protein DRW41_05395 [Neobacillus piezotolerans]|uniref:RloB domain-containing protein n=1 Tax=Neobacillus piezotolerans TaxID=2259171 RepID=A0A3D8GS64_9BACI|nr:RloB domain-containing protein [Neobacillus piezotolerans]RDU37288.1 hypothetical protein DRW41_05395 [Neobacillus piezotolerans]